MQSDVLSMSCFSLAFALTLTSKNTIWHEAFTLLLPVHILPNQKRKKGEGEEAALKLNYIHIKIKIHHM